MSPPPPLSSPLCVQEFKDEVDIMARLRHPNIVLFMGAVMQVSGGGGLDKSVCCGGRSGFGVLLTQLLQDLVVFCLGWWPQLLLPVAHWKWMCCVKSKHPHVIGCAKLPLMKSW
jgi:hypothetical protein